MDRNREGRRGGAIRHVSAARRPRATEIKYSSVSDGFGDEMMENELNSHSRFQERSKKFGTRLSPSIQESDSHKDLDKHLHKKRRVGSPLNHVPTITTVRNKGYGSDDTEIGRSDEEYNDLSRSSLHNRPLDLKLQAKARDNLSPIDTVVVPRKTRTAMTKRPQEVPHRNHFMNISKHQFTDSNTRTSSQTCNMNQNPVRRKKLENQKPSTSKSIKISSSKVSKTEVEVAETLFDLARMFTAQSVSTLQPEGLTNSATRSDLKPSPGGSSIDGASQSSTAALKIKNHKSNSKVKDENSMQALSPEPTASEHTIYSHSEKCAPASGSFAASPEMNTDSNNPIITDREALTTDVSSPASGEVRSVSDPQPKLLLDNSAPCSRIANRDTAVAENSTVSKELSNVECAESPQESLPVESGDCDKRQIDLAALPKDIAQTDGTSNAKVFKSNGNEEAHLNSKNLESIQKPYVTASNDIEEHMSFAATGLIANNPAEEYIRNTDVCISGILHSDWPEKREDDPWTTEKENSSKEKSKKIESLKEEDKQDIIKQSAKGLNKNTKSNSLAQSMDKAAAPAKSTRGCSQSTQLPASLGLGGWAGRFPVSYYTPMAAAAAAMAASWLKPVPMMASNENGTSSVKFPPLVWPPRQPRKRCVTHVYITHFIDWHEQLKSNPLWAAAYGHSSWNQAKEKGHADGAPSLKVNGITDRECKISEEREIKVTSEQKSLGATKNVVSSQNEPVLGLPINLSSAASVSKSSSVDMIASNGLISAAMLSSSMSAASSSISSVNNSGNVIFDGSTANASALQAQILNSVIQQPTFPFSVAPGHFASAYTGHLLPQQVPPLFQNPFYDTNILSQQSTRAKGNTPQKQAKGSQGGRTPMLGSSHLESQMSLQAEAPSQQEKLSEDCRPTLKMQYPGNQRNTYGQNFSSMQFSNSSHQPTVLPASMPGMPIYSPDFGLMTASSSMLTSKMKQHTQNNIQPQHLQMQQKMHVASQYYMPGVSLPADLKGIEPNASSESSQQVNATKDPISPELAFTCNTSTSLQGQNLVGEIRGPLPSSKPPQDQVRKLMSGQAQQISKLSSREQKHQQQKTVGAVENCIATNDRGGYAKIKHGDQDNISLQNDSTKSNLMKCEWGASPFMKGTQVPNGLQSNLDPKAVSNAMSSTLAFSENKVSQVTTPRRHPTDQGSHYLGQTDLVGNQSLRFLHPTQDVSQLKNAVAIAGPLPLEVSNSLTKYVQGGLNKTQGQQTRSEQGTSTGSPSERNIQVPSSSSTLAPSELVSVPVVSKSEPSLVTKNSGILKNSRLSSPKSVDVNASLKFPSTSSLSSVVASGQTSTMLQAQINQEHYNFPQYQQYQNMRIYHNLQLFDSQSNGQTVMQNYPNYPISLHKPIFPQEQHHQPGQHFISHPLENKPKGHSQVHSQAIAPQHTFHHHKKDQLSQQAGVAQLQNCNQVPSTHATSFGSTKGNMSHNVGTLNTGKSSNIASESASPQLKPTGDFDVSSSSVKVGSSDFSTASLRQSNRTLRSEPVNNNDAGSVPYAN